MNGTQHRGTPSPMGQQTALNLTNHPILKERNTMKEANRILQTLAILVLSVLGLVLAVKL